MTTDPRDTWLEKLHDERDNLHRENKRLKAEVAKVIPKPERTGIVTITNDDLWIMLLSTIRYSLGRQSYITSTCTNLCLRYGPKLTEANRRQIVNEIRQEFLYYENLYHKNIPDKAQWEETIQVLEDVK